MQSIASPTRPGAGKRENLGDAHEPSSIDNIQMVHIHQAVTDGGSAGCLPLFYSARFWRRPCLTGDAGEKCPESGALSSFKPFDAGFAQGQSVFCRRNFVFPAVKGIVGTGIGLYLIKTVVSLHGGEIALESKEGQGPAFRYACRSGFEGFCYSHRPRLPRTRPAQSDSACVSSKKGHTHTLPLSTRWRRSCADHREHHCFITAHSNTKARNAGAHFQANSDIEQNSHRTGADSARKILLSALHNRFLHYGLGASDGPGSNSSSEAPGLIAPVGTICG